MTALVRLADDINRDHAAAMTAAQSAIEHARRAGDLLLQAKSTVGHGEWLPWLVAHCPAISERTAQRYMRLADSWTTLEAKATRVSDLSLTGALQLLAEPKPDDNDLSAKARAQDDALRQIQRELGILQRALDNPDCSLEDLAAICSRVEVLEGNAWTIHMRAMWGLGDCLNRLTELIGPDATQFAAEHPDQFAEMAAARLKELQVSQ
jgi:hypothetical protein